MMGCNQIHHLFLIGTDKLKTTIYMLFQLQLLQSTAQCVVSISLNASINAHAHSAFPK